MSTSKELIDILATERQTQKLSANRLAKMTNMSHTSVSRIEKGEMIPTITTFMALAENLGFDVTLVKRDENSPAQTSQCPNIADIMSIANQLGYDVIPGQSITEQEATKPQVITLVRK